MDEMPGDIGHFDDLQDHDPLGFASHDSDLGGSGSLGSELFDSAPHDPADAIPVGDHDGHDAPHDSQPARPAETAAHHAPADNSPSAHVGTDHADPHAHETPHYPPPGSHLEMDISGIHYDTGQVDVDMNGDGHADTSVIHSVRDGVAQVEYYTDNNGDGHADELTITDDQGHLISHTELNEHTGHWDETHLDHRLPTELPDR